MLLSNKIELLYIKMLNYEKHQYEFGSNISKSRLNNLKIILLLQIQMDFMKIQHTLLKVALIQSITR